MGAGASQQPTKLGEGATHDCPSITDFSHGFGDIVASNGDYLFFHLVRKPEPVHYGLQEPQPEWELTLMALVNSSHQAYWSIPATHVSTCGFDWGSTPSGEEWTNEPSAQRTAALTMCRRWSSAEWYYKLASLLGLAYYGDGQIVLAGHSTLWCLDRRTGLLQWKLDTAREGTKFLCTSCKMSIACYAGSAIAPVFAVKTELLTTPYFLIHLDPPGSANHVRAIKDLYADRSLWFSLLPAAMYRSFVDDFGATLRSFGVLYFNGFEVVLIPQPAAYSNGRVEAKRVSYLPTIHLVSAEPAHYTASLSVGSQIEVLLVGQWWQ